MSNVGPDGRSFVEITRDDLARLAKIAALDRAQFFAAHPDCAADYSDRHIATALCQGAAMHYVYRQVGVHDFDVYSFYASHPRRHWYAKRIKTADFGDPKFGCSPDRPDLIGRRVDLLGRGINHVLGDSPDCSIRRWLATSAKSARLLAQKAVVLLEPMEMLGFVVWPPPPCGAA